MGQQLQSKTKYIAAPNCISLKSDKGGSENDMRSVTYNGLSSIHVHVHACNGVIIRVNIEWLEEQQIIFRQRLHDYLS